VSSSNLATWAVLLELKTVWIVAAVLLGDVVALFALDAGHGDLWADIRTLACHRSTPFNSLAKSDSLAKTGSLPKTSLA
jgi:hypothetical protein